MTDHDLPELLDRLGERAPVGPPPTAAMLTAATRARRRRTTWFAVGSTAAVLATSIGAAALLNQPTEHVLPEPAPGAATPTPVVTPPGTRLVGIGHLAIAVPKEWDTNALRCGTPNKDTVIIDQGAICAAFFPRPKDVESVHLYPGWYGGFGERSKVATTPMQVDGEPAERVATTCEDAYNETAVFCRGAVYLPDADLTFLADSSSQDSKAKVDEILSWIRVVPDQVAVPGYQGANMDWQDDDAGAHYLAELERLGLAVEVVTEKRPGSKEGFLLGVEPQPGTMLSPGQTVMITKVAAPEGPADELSVEVNSVGPGDSMDYRGLSDAQLRRNASIHIDLGATIWVHGFGKRIGTLAGSPSGSALVLDDWKEGPNYGRSWKAVERGTSILTVTIEADGERIVLGNVTVIID